MRTKIMKIAVIAMLMMAINLVQTLAAAPTLDRLISESAPILVQDEGGMIEISLDDVLKYRGSECPMAMLAFRATQLAIVKLWDGKIPRRDDFRIISFAPFVGVRDCLEFITRASTRPEREGDFEMSLPRNFSPENLYVIFIQKSSGKKVKIWTKQGLLPKNLKIGSKIIAGQIIEIDRDSIPKEVIEKLLTSPLNELFEYKIGR